MRRNIRKTNNSVMFGIIALALAVLLIVVLFLGLCMPPGQNMFSALTK